MKLSSKIVAVGGVVLAGTVAALFFRKPAAAPGPDPAAPSASPLPMRDAAAAKPAAAPAVPVAPQGVPSPVPPAPPENVHRIPSGGLLAQGAPALTPPQLPPAFQNDSARASTPAVAKSPPLP